jgi:uncharacterized small protein (DUF1192 family)
MSSVATSKDVSRLLDMIAERDARIAELEAEVIRLKRSCGEPT